MFQEVAPSASLSGRAVLPASCEAIIVNEIVTISIRMEMLLSPANDFADCLLIKLSKLLRTEHDMNIDLLTKVKTEDGTFMVLTKTRYFFFFSMPRSSVMPFDAANFSSTPGFQIHYNTSDSVILVEWHELLCEMLHKGLFQFMADGSRVSYFPYPDDKKKLEHYVKRFL